MGKVSHLLEDIKYFSIKIPFGKACGEQKGCSPQSHWVCSEQSKLNQGSLFGFCRFENGEKKILRGKTLV